MKSCWFKAVAGYEPDEWSECKHECDSCSYYMSGSPEPSRIHRKRTIEDLKHMRYHFGFESSVKIPPVFIDYQRVLTDAISLLETPEEQEEQGEE